MKFLAELRSCFVPGGSQVEPRTEEDGGRAAAPAPGPKRKATAAQWKPTLSMIAEDGVVLAAKGSEVVQTTTLPSKKKATVKRRRQRVNFGFPNEHREPLKRMIIPEISPMPFMF